MVFTLATIFLLRGVVVGADAQSAKALPNDVIAANQELDRQLLEGHRLLDAEKVMAYLRAAPTSSSLLRAATSLRAATKSANPGNNSFASLESITERSTILLTSLPGME